MIKSRRSDYIWNTVGGLIFALNSVILLMVVVQILGPGQGGIFSIAYTVSQTLLIIGCFEMKVFQVTDRGKYSFQEYFQSRIYTSGIMLIVAVGWILINGFALEKAALTMILCMYRFADSFGDVIEGYFQQTDRLYISGKLLSARTGIPTLFFICSLLITQNLLFSAFLLMIMSLSCLIVFDFGSLYINDRIKLFGGNNNRTIKLLLICLPLFVSSFLASYITNAPKYAIDRHWNEELQTYYSVIFMPSFVINLLSGFVFKPLLVEVTSIWENGKLDRVTSIILKMSVWIVMITLLCVMGGWLLGIPILSLVYGLNELYIYKKQFIVILIGGGVNAYNIFLYYLLTVMREQKYILAGYAVVFLESVVLSNILVKEMELRGATMSYLICNISLGLIFFCKIFYKMGKLKNLTHGRKLEDGETI